MEEAKLKAAIGAVLSDTVAGCFALCTENESGGLLTQRVKDIDSALNSLHHLVKEFYQLKK